MTMRLLVVVVLELKVVEVYANGFIRPSKSPAGAPILFDRKPDGSLVSIIEAPTMFPAMSISMAKTVTIAMIVSMAMIDLTLQDKLGKV